MNLIDLLLFFIILLNVFSGYQRGFILGTINLFSLFCSLVFAFWASGYVALFFQRYISTIGVWTLPLSFIISFIFANSILNALALKLMERISPKIHENIANKALGVFPGAINGIIYAAVISSLLLAIPISNGVAVRTRESSIANALTPHVQWAEHKLSPVFGDALEHSISNMTIKPGSKTSVELDFSVADPPPREDLEAEMLEMINEERRKEGLDALKADPEMRTVARAHSKDMFAKSYFSHINKEGESPAQRARKSGVRFLTAGENLALAPTLKFAHEGLMNSPGHRANILHRSFGRVGIGILDGGKHGLMVTQNFRN